MIFWKNPILHNSSFMRVWPKTIIIVKFALKFWLDSTSQISKMIFLDPFREDFHFLPKIRDFLRVSGPSKLTFHQPLASKLHLREFAPTKNMLISILKPEKHHFSTHFLKNPYLSHFLHFRFY